MGRWTEGEEGEKRECETEANGAIWNCDPTLQAAFSLYELRLPHVSLAWFDKNDRFVIARPFSNARLMRAPTLNWIILSSKSELLGLILTHSRKALCPVQIGITSGSRGDHIGSTTPVALRDRTTSQKKKYVAVIQKGNNENGVDGFLSTLRSELFLARFSKCKS